MKEDLTREQFAAIELAKKKGMLIARDCPGIVDNYRAGMTLRGIAEEYGFSEAYGVNERIASRAVAYALHELIPEDELVVLAAEHYKASGLKLFEDGRGIHALTPEQRREICRRGGQIGGQKIQEEGLGIFSMTPEELLEACRRAGRAAHEKGVGIHSLTPEQRAEAGRMGGLVGGRRTYEEGLGVHSLTPEQKAEAGRMGSIAAGFTPWSDEERDCFISLCHDPDYQYASGRHEGQPDYRRISAELRASFGTRRSLNSLRVLQGKLKRASEAEDI